MKIITDPSQITIIVCGPVKSATPQVIASIQKFYPLSPIVLSSNNDYHDDSITIIKNPEWPAFPWNMISHINNVNEALKKVTTPYTIKIRTDQPFVNNNLLENWLHYPSFNQEYKIFSDRIVATNFYTHSIEKLGMYICDWAFAGKTEDMKNMFDIPSNLLNPNIAPEHTLPRYHIFNKLNLNWQHDCHTISPAEKIIENKVMINNYLILNGTTQFGLTSHCSHIQENSSFNIKHDYWLHKYKEI